MAGSDGAALAAEHERLGLHADCGSCFALCCVALAFSASADFAIDKAIGEPCPNLADDLACTIHDELRPRGFAGCTTYDCFGAGQHVSQVTFRGIGWRDDPTVARPMFAALPVVRQLHELLWYLADARSRPAAASLHAELGTALDEVVALTALGPDDLAALDVAAVRGGVNRLLLAASELVRAEVPGAEGRRSRRGADLVGARLAGADLRGVDLRGAYLIGADLRGARLGGADLIGADLRDAHLAGADLATGLFLSQAQVDAARGDAATRLPATLRRPRHWAPPPTSVAVRSVQDGGDPAGT